MKTDKAGKSFSPPMVGGSSLLIIFAVLCLTVFTLLALSTVQADGRLSDASIRAVSDYYDAELEAQTVLASLRAGQIPQNVTVEGDIYSYACPISNTQELAVQVRIDQNSWTILRWQAVSTVTY